MFVKILPGDTGLAVDYLNTKLKNSEKDYGPFSQNQIKKIQLENGLEPSAIVDDKTWKTILNNNRIKDLLPVISIPQKQTSYSDTSSHFALRLYDKYKRTFSKICKYLNIETSVALAILAVESQGQAYHPSTGKILIRFEVHKFYEFWGKENSSVFNANFRFNQNKIWTEHQQFIDGQWFDIHKNQISEYKAYEQALKLDRSATLLSTSYGLPQIMGFNSPFVGFDKVENFVSYMTDSEENQIICFFQFILSDSDLLLSLQNKDWKTFAKIYNGTGQIEFYSSFMERMYTKFINQEKNE